MVADSVDVLMIGAMQLVRDGARSLERPWSKRVIFSVTGEVITAWLLAPNRQKFAVDSFHYSKVDGEALYALCDDIWASVDEVDVAPPTPEVSEADIERDEAKAREHVHSFIYVDYTFPQDVEIGYNGQMFRAKAGVPVKIPQCVLQTYLDSMKEQEETMARMAALSSHSTNLMGEQLEELRGRV